MTILWWNHATPWHGACEYQDMLLKTALPDFLQHRLAREIVIAIAIKLVVIVAIFYAFFDGRALEPDAARVADRIANSQQQDVQQSQGAPHAD